MGYWPRVEMRPSAAMEVVVGPLLPAEVDRADAIFRRAFATFLGAPDPSNMFGDSDGFRTRFRAGNTRVLAARIDGELVGSSVVTRWGSLGLLGPLTVTPDRWASGVAKALMAGTAGVLDDWKVSARGLFTFPQSGKHLALYQKFGYWPRFLTPIFERTVDQRTPPSEDCRSLRELPTDRRSGLLGEIRELCDKLLPGLDVTGEVRSVEAQRLGETLVLMDDSRVVGFAVCHLGAGSEAGGGATYVKFAAVAPGDGAPTRLRRLLEGVESLALSRGAPRVESGANSAHRDSVRTLIDRGYRAEFVGVAMHSPDEPAYHRPELQVLDDWR
ncbi:MAG: GNAT family N-acetyltransferase [Thermoplasmata archaeon]|nr:GNAT family N-acetyltransferase [Thermoplasmata archaeon]